MEFHYKDKLIYNDIVVGQVIAVCADIDGVLLVDFKSKQLAEPFIGDNKLWKLHKQKNKHFDWYDRNEILIPSKEKLLKWAKNNNSLCFWLSLQEIQELNGYLFNVTQQQDDKLKLTQTLRNELN